VTGVCASGAGVAGSCASRAGVTRATLARSTPAAGAVSTTRPPPQREWAVGLQVLLRHVLLQTREEHTDVVAAQARVFADVDAEPVLLLQLFESRGPIEQIGGQLRMHLELDHLLLRVCADPAEGALHLESDRLVREH